MINPSPSSRGRDPWAALTVLAFVLTVGGVICLGVLTDEVPLLREAYGRWKGLGYVLITMLAVAVPVGALLHSFGAASAGRSVRQGWYNSALVLAYGALVALLAWQLGPDISDYARGGRGVSPLGAYYFWLTCVLPAFAVAACLGGLFPRVRLAAPVTDPAGLQAQDQADAPSDQGGARPHAPRRFYRVVLRTAGICWAVGALPFLLTLLTAYVL